MTTMLGFSLLLCGASALLSGRVSAVVAFAAAAGLFWSVRRTEWGWAAVAAAVFAVVASGALTVLMVMLAVGFLAAWCREKVPVAPRARLRETWWLLRLASWRQKRAVWQLRRGWNDVTHYAGLTTSDTRPDSEVTRWVPTLVETWGTPAGLRMVVLPAPGTDAGSWAAACEVLATQWAARAVRVVPEDSIEGLVVLDLTVLDAMEGTRMSAYSDEARLADADAGVPDSPESVWDVVVGRDDDGMDVVVDVRDAWHFGMQGMTRSGKSAAMYTLLGGLARNPAVVVCGVDPTIGVLDPWRGYGHDGWIATGRDFAAYAEVLERLVAELDAREQMLFGHRGWGADKIEPDDFSRDLPVIVVVFEEWPGILKLATKEDARLGRKTAEKVAPRIADAHAVLIQQGAKTGFRVVTLAQRMSANALDTDLRSNLGFRATLMVDDPHAVGMLHGDSTDWVSEVARFPQGRALLDRPGHRRMTMQFDLTTYADYKAEVLRHRVVSGETEEPLTVEDIVSGEVVEDDGGERS